MGFLAGYTTRIKLTANRTLVDSDLTDFPVVVKLTNANFDFSKANADGFDIRFTSDDGETLLDYERERHDNVNELAEYWVKLPAVSSASDTIFYIYYRTTDTVDGANPGGVWDGNFELVTHMYDNPDTSTIQDSSSNAFTGNKKGANEPIEFEGGVGRSQHFDGNNDYVVIADNPVLDIVNDLTIEAWVYIDVFQAGDFPMIVNKPQPLPAPTRYVYCFYINANTRELIFVHRNAAGDPETSVSTDLISADTWTHVAVTISGTTLTFYINGTPDSGGTHTLANARSANSGDVFIGSRLAAVEIYNLDGKIDELRISSGNRAAGWVKASYNSVNDSLISFSNEQSPGYGLIDGESNLLTARMI